MILARLLNNILITQVSGQAESVDIKALSIDSRYVDKNTLFFAVRGFKEDGHDYLQSAINNGCPAVVIDKDGVLPDEFFIVNNIVKILVDDSRKALAEFARNLYSDASEELTLVGVTGTKGKTTTAFFIKNLFESVYGKCGLLGTIANYAGNEIFKSKLTTPQSHEINYYLRRMLDDSMKHCVMEVSSHALPLNRVDGLKYNIAVFMNLTSDHMDYHKTKENYLNSKKILFDMLSEDSFALVNSDDDSSTEIVKDTKAKVVSFGKKEGSDFYIHDISYDINTTEFKVRYQENEYHLSTKLIGEFNSYNATAAFACGVLSGINPEKAVEAIAKTPQVPGRMEVLSKDDKKVLIDYSHTADSLRQALLSLQHIVKGERPIYTMFGCGGDRDTTKRPIMGEIATSMSDYAVLTSDNPRTEDPFKIIEEVKKGIKTDNYRVIENREEAIKNIIKESPENAVVLIAGKGHEDYQEINGVRSYFSDKETAEKYLNE